jgi:choline dehydrogenase-like flavoprotein
MDVQNLTAFDTGSKFEADLVIVGGGPVGLTIAREFFGTATRVLVLESGLHDETAAHTALSQVEVFGEPLTSAQKAKREAFHGPSLSSWTQSQQPYGARCRALGGSTHAWAGKSAAFDAIDFSRRSWVPYSGWPITREGIMPFVDRAGQVLNLGPNIYDEGLWELIGSQRPRPQLTAEGLQSFFWQFARSRLKRFDPMRFGEEFVTSKADNVRVLLNATVTEIGLHADNSGFEQVQISTIDGVRSTVKAPIAVIAASGIENARLLLASKSVHGRGIGNANDVVGRFLMDHASARVGRFDPDGIAQVVKHFGFYGVRQARHRHMYMLGLAPTPELQQREQLLNAAVYFMPTRAVDDPWDALKRLYLRRSADVVQDVLAVVSNAPLIAKGLGGKAISGFETDKAEERGWPHKLDSVSIDAVSEQRPDPDSRISLSEKFDRLGVPLARVDWRISDDERRTIIRMGHLVSQGFSRVGLSKPILEPWVTEHNCRDTPIIDMAHTLGTTRMADDPKHGVVDRHCQVHGVNGLYVAGGSIFPTSGHANPTLMMLAFAIRLADTIKSREGVQGNGTNRDQPQRILEAVFA